QDPPHVLTRVRVRGADVGTARVIATAAGLADTMDVATFAATIEVTDPDPVGTIVSGESQTFTFKYLSATGRDLTAQVPVAPTWTVDTSGAADPADTLKATVDPVTGTMTGRDFGTVKVLATGPGLPKAGITGSASVFVEPAPFQGAITPDSSNPSGIITITPGSGPAFNPDTRVFLNRAAVPADAPNSEGDSVVSVTPSAIDVFLGDLRTPGKLELILAGVGASQISVGTDTVPGPPVPDSLAVQLPGLAGTATPDPVDPGALLTISAGGGPAFDADTRVYLNGELLADDTPDAIVSQTASAIDVEMNDLRSAGRLELRLTRVGAGQSAQADSVDVSAPAAFTGLLSATSVRPAQILKITRAAGGPAFDADTRVFFDGIEAFIAEGGTADVINVAVPVIDKLAQVELRMTRLDAAQEAEADSVNSPTKSFNDPYDAVNNDPSTAPGITANGDYFVVLYGGCHDLGNGIGEATGAADCDDWFKITNSGGSDASVTINLFWGTDADEDLYVFDDQLGFVDGSFFGDGEEEVTVTIPAGATWYVYLNLFESADIQHELSRVRVSGLP
ncbi:MAG TPA: hypothetical protein VEK86_01370, partial [Gemmatimonadales bacterium]|nr:hypothetical protein [Gemmatimonadales bacterium]